MEYVWVAAILFMAVSMAMLLIRALLGPTIFDRILVANLFGTNVVLLIAIMAFAGDEKNYIDVALVYALLNFAATIGFLRFFKYGDFQHVEVSEDKKPAKKAKKAAAKKTKKPRVTVRAKSES